MRGFEWLWLIFLIPALAVNEATQKSKKKGGILGILLALLGVLGVWKAVELIIWVVKHVNISIN